MRSWDGRGHCEWQRLYLLPGWPCAHFALGARCGGGPRGRGAGGLHPTPPCGGGPVPPALLSARAKLAPGTPPDQTARTAQGAASPWSQLRRVGRPGACEAGVGEHMTQATVHEAPLPFLPSSPASDSFIPHSLTAPEPGLAWGRGAYQEPPAWSAGVCRWRGPDAHPPVWAGTARGGGWRQHHAVLRRDHRGWERLTACAH